jgi:hypothetical protein
MSVRHNKNACFTGTAIREQASLVIRHNSAKSMAINHVNEVVTDQQTNLIRNQPV